MNAPFQRPYGLVRRGGPGLACDEDGLTLGALELARARQDIGGARRCEVRSPAEIDRILCTAYGPLADGVVQRVHRGLRRAAAWIEAGDLGRAGVEAVKLGVPALPLDAMTKLADLADLEKAGEAWEDQPRVPAGQTGGGQWTDGDGGAQAANPPTPAKAPPPLPARPAPRKSNLRTRRKPPQHPTIDDGSGLTPAVRSLLVHVSSPSIAIGLPGAQVPAVPRIIVPSASPAQLLSMAAALLDAWDRRRAKEQIISAMARFKLDSRRQSDVMAAAAYVWSRYTLPIRFDLDIPARGPGLDAASEAVMRYVMIRPNALPAMMQGDHNAYSAIVDAADRGLSDYVWESRGRPAGVEPALQTKSRAARAAVDKMIESGRMAAHHLIPAKVWGDFADITRLARQEKWNQDGPSNVIGLPVDPAAQAEALAALKVYLPIHNSPHVNYTAWTESRVAELAGPDRSTLTPQRARAIYEWVAMLNAQRIVSGQFGEFLRVAT
jgi:hypothetical protein